jgi:predicted flap endonuclease-1-like 5' DNA nuclease
MCTLCILIPVLVGLICALLGYLLGKRLSGNTDNLSKLQSDLENCKAEREKQLQQINSLTKENESLILKLKSPAVKPAGSTLQFTPTPEISIPFDAASAAKAFGKKIAHDDLKIVEGIGPKIEGLFHAAGIKTWKSLGETSVEKCQQILDNAGERYRVHNPGTWPKQSEMAYQGKWEELKEWQNTHIAGKE